MAEVAEDGLLGLLPLFTVVPAELAAVATAELGEGFLDLGFSAIEVMILYMRLRRV